MKSRKQWLKKILSVSFCTAVIGAAAAFIPKAAPDIGIAPQVAAYYEDDYEEPDYSYDSGYITSGDYEIFYDDEYKTAFLTEYKGKSANLTIPSTIKGYEVWGIYKEAFAYNDYIQNVTIPDTVLKIYEDAFIACENLKTVQIPSSVVEIEGDPFNKSEYIAYDGMYGSTYPDEVKLKVEKGSYAEKFAKQYGYEYSYIPTVNSLKLNKTSTAIAPGKSETLKVTVDPASLQNQALTWSTSNSKVATVNNGKITAVANGTATITVKSKNGKTATCKVTVTSTITGITLNKTSATLGAGESISLKTTLSPTGISGNVTWSSSNSGIATVSGGKVTAKKTGTATITAKTSNGKTASCKITVKSAPTKVTITKGSLTLGVGEKYTLGSGINNGAGCATRTFRTSNSSIVKMTRTDWQGDMVAVKPGTAYVTVRTYNGKEATCKVTVKSAPTKVTLTKGVLTLGVGEKFTLGCGVNDGAGAAKRTFRTSNASIVKLTRTDWQGNMVAVKPGTAYVTVRLYNGKEATCKVTVKSAPTKVSLNKGVLTLGVGETYKLSASLPNNTASAKRTFRTSNGNVVKMTKTDWEGQFKAMKVGTAYVTVRTFNGKEASCKITVKAAPSKVTLNKSVIYLGVGDSAQLSTSIPNGSAAATRTFRTSNSNVLRMTSTNWVGKFIGKNPGTSYVTVRLYNGKEASCKVVVRKTIETINFDRYYTVLKVGQQRKFNIDFKYLGDSNYYSNNVKFTSSNSGVLKIVSSNETSVTVKPLKQGTVTITASALIHSYSDYGYEDQGYVEQKTTVYVPDPKTNNDPIIFISLSTSTPNSADGVDVYASYYNNSNKTIKYFYFTVEAYNQFGDPEKCEIHNSSTRELRLIGPSKPNEADGASWENVWYNGWIDHCKWIRGKCRVEYTDGTSVTF